MYSLEFKRRQMEQKWKSQRKEREHSFLVRPDQFTHPYFSISLNIMYYSEFFHSREVKHISGIPPHSHRKMWKEKCFTYIMTWRPKTYLFQSQFKLFSKVSFLVSPIAQVLSVTYQTFLYVQIFLNALLFLYLYIYL